MLRDPAYPEAGHGQIVTDNTARPSASRQPFQGDRPQWWWPLLLHARHLMLAGLPVAMIIALIGFLRDPQFESRALVEVQAPMFAGAEQDARLAASLPTLMETQKAIVASAAVAGDLASDLRVEVVPRTFLLALHYRAADAEAARSGASAVAQAYVEFAASSQVQEMRRAASLLIARLDSLTRLPEPSQPDVGNVAPPLAALNADPLQDLVPPLVTLPPDAALTGQGSAGQRVLGPVLESALVSELVRSYEATLGQMISARILESASLPQTPLPSGQWWWVMLGYIGSVAVPALVLAARFQWRGSLDFPADVPARLARSCAGSLPLTPAVTLAEFLADRPYAQALAELRTRLQLRRAAPDPLVQFPKGRVLLTCSTAAGEGKSTLAACLALTLGRSERVLLINADLRHSQEFMGLPARAPGLSHLIAGAAQLRDCVHSRPELGIDVIPAGVLPPNPQELLAGKRLRRVLEMLQRRYDTLIIDTPALAQCSDAMLLGPVSDDILYVLAAGSRDLEQTRSHLHKFDMAELGPIHLVMNRTQSIALSPLPLWKGAA